MIAAGTTRASVASFEASRNEKNDTGISCRHRELIRWGLIDGTNTPVTIEENSSLLFDEDNYQVMPARTAFNEV
ncbi:hypothetical protein FOZ60_016023 [Perkinsus olseni]|uniref:Uncharacterized protein n=1 Tax=Perkinsus olseni TaxID=32597 RepID=A0A7J6TH89_PEROL|nr:hypothetical protein FOZ60_016023 [Perkinsus olseni]KAF4744261.1 hypothetical protein FOZ62_031066 [Perkinsus olseni]